MSFSGQQIEEIFHAALGRPPAEREAYIVQAAAGDHELLARVRGLLASHEAAGDAFLPLPTDTRPPGESPGSTIGPYKLLQQIGEGGFGVVFMADQEGPFRRRVALKVIKAGMDTRLVIARFEAERQALAMMDHPNIARVFDAGATPAGRPYFVMELVRGVAITQFCDEQSLPIPQRLELFIQVCQALQHAHQKGLIHRDLKPSNVLVSMQDNRPAAKVIDFGIAKATEARLTEKTLFTEFQQMVGTPSYMSPEQAGGSFDVDTRSDVYALGVLLYELLAGATPFDARELRSKAFGEIQRIIREVDPPAPSTRLSTLDALPSVAANRATEPRKLGAALRGELDWIVMKCLEKDRERRYASAAGLAEDLAHHLAHQPVSAGPPSRWYKARKFVRRNRLAVLSGVGFVLLLLAGVVGTTLGLLEARRQRDEARRAKENMDAVNAFLTEDVLKSAEPGRARGKDVTVKQAVDAAAEEIGQRFAGQPLTEAAVRSTLATTYLALGHADQALPHAQAALEIRRRILGNEHLDTLLSINNLGLILRSLGRLDEAEILWREAVDTGGRTLGAAHENTTVWTFNLGHLAEDRGRLDNAEHLYRTAYENWRAALGPEHERTLAAVNRLAGLLMVRGRLSEAEPMLEQALSARRRTLGNDHPDTLYSINDLGLLRQNQGRLDDCEALYREAVDGFKRVLGPEHPFTLVAMNNVGSLLHKQNRAAEAEPMLRAAAEASRRAAGADHPRTLMFAANLATALAKQGKYADAEALLREVVGGFEERFGATDRRTITCRLELGRVLTGRQRFAEAELELLAAERALAPATDAAEAYGRTVRSLVELYEAWDQVQPAQNHDQSAQRWRARRPTTAPTGK